MIKVEELTFFKWSAIARHIILNIDRKPESGNVVFIDISKDLALTDDPQYDAFAGLSGAKTLITDRHKLTRLLDTLNAHPNDYKFVLCDILFEAPSDADSAFKSAIEKTPKLVATAIWNKEKFIKPLFNIPYGEVNYNPVEDLTFTKFPLYYRGNVPSLPIKMYEGVKGESINRKAGIVLLDGYPAFNHLIPEFYYRSADLYFSGESGAANTHFLGELFYDPTFFKDFLKNKYIVIGDFSGDIHTTYLEDMPGPLILWNTFLTLEQHPPIIHFWWQVVVFIFYFIISYWIIIHPERKLEEVHEMIRVPVIKEFLIKGISFIGLMVIISLISSVFFGTFISLFYIATYLTLLQLIIDKWPAWSKIINKMRRHRN